MVNVTFKVQYKTAFRQKLVLTGDAGPLGQWTVSRSQPMKWSSGDTWSCRVPLPAGSTLECKYVVVDETGTAVRWQEGTNMSFRVPTAFEGQALQDFEVAMSWCKTYSAFSAQPLTSPAAALAAATAPAVAAWAMAKGASPAPSRAVSPAPAAGAFAGASGSSVPPTFSQPAKPAAVSTLPPSVVSAALPPGAKPNGMAAEVALAAASAILQPSTPTPSSASGAGRTAAAAAFSSELTPGTEDSPGGMSMTLPPRSSSPPFKLSLSSNLAQLMELPSTLSRSGSGGNLAASASASAVSPAAPSTPTAPAPAPVRAASPVKAAAAVAPSSFPIDLPASAASSRAASPAPSRPVVAPMPASASSSVSSYGRQAPSPSHYDAASGYGSSEYDMWASAYGMPYMHTPFDLDAYAEVDQTAPEPTPAASLRSPSPKAVAPPVPGTDLLESAMQAARGPSPRASEPASVAASKAAAPSIFANPAPAAATAAGAQSIFSAAPKAASPKPSASKPAAAPAPAPAATPTFASASTSASAAPAASAPASPGLPSYRSVSCSSPAVSRWADQTLFELSASSIASDEDSDEEAAAETESLVAHALEAPVTAEDMSVLLKQLGGALGRSVRMRHEGKDSAATDLLELDRQIALASSRLYRKRDNLLVGFVKTETRRQLAAATAAVAPSRAPSSQRTPV